MQCQSYFPPYRSHYDLNTDNNRGIKPIYNGNGIFQSGLCNNNNNMLSSPVAGALRQTIIIHDVTFRDQVRELHRLYQRQKELMSEVRSKEMYRNQLNLGRHCSYSCSEKLVCDNNVLRNGGSLNNVLGRESKGRKIGRKLLDLELPAEEYIDIEEGENPSTNLFGETKTSLADLNEPLIASDLEDRIPKESKRSYLNSDSKHLNGLIHLDLNSAIVVESSEFTCDTSSSSKAVKEVYLERKDVMSLSHEDSVNLRSTKRTRLIDINLPCDLTMEEGQPAVEDDIEYGHENPAQINSNLSVNDDGLHSKSSFSGKTSLEIDLEAPPSPEVEERPPPRGDSEETHPESSLQVTTPENDINTIEELTKNAAEAIVTISSSSTSHVCPEKCEPSDTATLEWFAGLVQSFSSDLMTHFETLSSGNVHTYTLDEYEAMTLNLPEIKTEETLIPNKVQTDTFFSSSAPELGQTRKGRAKRSKRKDFQREILPSLASLSRYEVTEDIQMIEGLMEAAGTPWQLNRGRRGCRVGRKPRETKPEGPTFDEPVKESSCGALLGWGKANRRPRGRRSPASPCSVLSKWLEYVV